MSDVKDGGFLFDGVIIVWLFLRQRHAWRHPLLIGLAFEVQRVERLAEETHDVQLDGVVTERGVYGRAAARLRGPLGGTGR